MGKRHDPKQQQQLRDLLAPLVASGQAVCPKCRAPIGPHQAWDAGHRTDLSKQPQQAAMTASELVGGGLVRPEHRRCNRSAGATAGNKARNGHNAPKNGHRGRSLEAGNDSGLRFSDPSPRVQASPGLVVRPRVRSGMVLPRLETPKTRGVRSLGGEAIRWINASGLLGSNRLLPWQEYALTRGLELRGKQLRWRVVIVTVSRQSGKSVGARSLCWWRIHQEERFGEPQLLLHTANLATTAREVWRPAALHAMARYGRKASKFGKGQEEIDLLPFDVHGRWVVQAANDNTGVGYSLSMGLVDEGWNVPRAVVDEALLPAMSEREQPQLWIVSTAGDSSSDLLQAYRDIALQDTSGTGDILLLEWSAPPEAPYDDVMTWRWASPNWSPRREAFLRSQLQAIPETAFRTQYLNQWVKAVGAWIPPTTWARGGSDAQPVGVPDVVAVEVSPDGDRYAMVSAWTTDAGCIVRARATQSASVLWRWVEDEPVARRLLLPPPLAVHYTGRQRPEIVGTTEAGRYLIGVGRAIAEGRVLHDPGDHVLNDDIGRAVAVQTESGLRLSVRKSPGPTEAARAMVWAVGELLKPAAPRPRIRSA